MINTSAKTKGAVQHNGSVPDGTPQPEWQVVDDGKGMLTGTLKFFYNYKTGGSTESGGSTMHEGVSHTGGNSLGYAKASGGGVSPTRGDRHPYDSRLVCTQVTRNFQSNDICYVDAEYIGIAMDPSGIEWELSCPTEDTAIELHPNFLKASSGFEAVTQEGINPQTNAPYWNKEVVIIERPLYKFDGFVYSEKTVEKKLAGVESYKLVRPTFRISYSTCNSDNVNKMRKEVGKWTGSPYLAPNLISQMTGVQVSSTPRDPNNGSENWLYSSINVSEFAGIYKVQTEYIMSGRGGWNTIIYEEAQFPD